MSPRTPDSFTNAARVSSPRSPLAGRLPGLQAAGIRLDMDPTLPGRVVVIEPERANAMESAGVYLDFDPPRPATQHEVDQARAEALDRFRKQHAAAPSRMLPDEDWTDQLARSLTVDLDEEADPLWPARLAKACRWIGFGLAVATLAVVVGVALAYVVGASTS